MTSPPDTNISWQPIETAPKDGLRFVGRVLVARLWQSEETEEWHLAWAQVATLMSSGWHATTEGWATGGMACVGPLNPTHWMPLPRGLQ